MKTYVGETKERRGISVQGIVQGVGFRPFVYTLARRYALTGSVQNTAQGVLIEIEGPPSALAAFQRALSEEQPPLAHILSLAVTELPTRGDADFIISQSSASAERQALISPDTAICADCLHELFDPGDRRYRYPFLNCTNCGPRFTIIQDVPYDRAKTTMQAFTLCSACKHEYLDPTNRRFHAQPNACPVCGPRVALVLGGEEQIDIASDDIFRKAASLLEDGAILAIKGLGGFHLACNALHEEAVQRLRGRKQREAKPFALMVPDLETARQLCEVDEQEAALLQTRQRPIVLLERHDSIQVATAVAPMQRTLGIMLPYTPLHYLLLDACKQAWAAGRPVVLVMTSGNLSDEPIAYRDEEARTRLAPLIDGMLTHNREIHMRCDDSVLRITSQGQQFLRRSRGFVPEPIILPFELPAPLLACGGHLKNTFCLGKEKRAFVSQHIGDLENLETLLSFHEGIEHFQRLFDIQPQAIAYDLHPEYLATKYALDSEVPYKIGVQHHHAHIASVLVEHGLHDLVIGIAADGTGYGTDGAIWGCEIMLADLRDFTRLAHLAYIPLVGGEQAVRQPWRVAAAYLERSFGKSFLEELDIPFVHQLNRPAWRILSQMMERKINSPETSSLGRLFDAVAALLGVRQEVLYEGQAACELEVLAQSVTDPGSVYPFALQDDLLDVSELFVALVNDIANGIPAAQTAHSFHNTVASMLVAACEQARARVGVNRVALSGGVFQNVLLLEKVCAALRAMGFQIYTNRLVPPNDGGLCLGQLGVAAARLQEQSG